MAKNDLKDLSFEELQTIKVRAAKAMTDVLESFVFKEQIEKPFKHLEVEEHHLARSLRTGLNLIIECLKYQIKKKASNKHLANTLTSQLNKATILKADVTKVETTQARLSVIVDSLQEFLQPILPD